MGAVYYIAAGLGLFFGIPAVHATPVWLAAGIALAGTLLFAVRISPGKPPEFSRRRQVLITAPLIIVFTLLVIASIYTHAGEQDRIKQVFERRTNYLAKQLEVTVLAGGLI